MNDDVIGLLGAMVGLFLCAVTICAAWFVARALLGQDRVRVRRRVLVNLDTGRTFAGVLWCKTGDWLVLREAEMIERGKAAVPVDGETVIERARVEFVQVL